MLQSVSGLRTELESISREGVAKVKYVTPPNLEQAVSALELGFTTTGVSLLEVTCGELLSGVGRGLGLRQLLQGLALR